MRSAASCRLPQAKAFQHLCCTAHGPLLTWNDEKQLSKETIGFWEGCFSGWQTSCVHEAQHGSVVTECPLARAHRCNLTSDVMQAWAPADAAVLARRHLWDRSLLHLGGSPGLLRAPQVLHQLPSRLGLHCTGAQDHRPCCCAGLPLHATSPWPA